MTPPGAANASARAQVAPGGRRLAPPRRARRVSGPARGTQPARKRSPQTAPRTLPGGLLARLPSRLLDVLQALPRQRPLDRLIRGRAWIALVAFALIGIVTLQLGLLQLNSRIGHALESGRLLQRENSSLSVEDSSLSSPEHVEARAALAGMRVAPESSLRFLDARSGDLLQRASSALARPAGAAQRTATAAEGAAASAGTSETAAASGGTSETADAGAGTSEAAGASAAAPPVPSAAAAAGASTETAQTAEAQSSAATSASGGSASAGESSVPAGGAQPGDEAGSAAGAAGAG